MFALGTPLEEKIMEIRLRAAAEIMVESMVFIIGEEERLLKAKTDYFEHVESITKRDIGDTQKTKEIIDSAEETLNILVDTEET